MELCANPEFTALAGTYDLRLLALSVVLAALTPYAGFEVVNRARATRGWAGTAWIAIGGAAFGIALCGVTAIAICAFQPSIPIRYHYPTLLLALADALAAATIGVFAVTGDCKSLPRTLAISCVAAVAGTSIPYCV